MTALASPVTVRPIDRAALVPWLPALDEWLLPGSLYSVHHTWPQLYRSDGHGRHFGAVAGDRLLSHCAYRLAELHHDGDCHRVALLGSVATDPDHRGHGLATAVLDHALATAAAEADHVLLWAERPDLYARAGFRPSPPDTALVLARRPNPDRTGIRFATIADHPALHTLHERKPRRIARSGGVMSGLLTTPGLTTVVRERDGAVVAYACCGKGADLHGHWHELGGDDAELAALLPVALHLAEQTEAVLLVPSYRPGLAAALGRAVIDRAEVPGPMVRSFRGHLPAAWVDGLDSV